MKNSHIFIKEKTLCITKERLISYTDGCINVYDREANNRKIQSCRIGNGIISKGIVARLLRNEPRCAALIDKNTCLISNNGSILNYNVSENTFFVEHKYDRGMKNPLTFCIVKDDNGFTTAVYYGEYIWNKDCGPVAIYKREDGIWTKVYEFPPNTITHIHNIVYDCRKKLFYILTGDTDEAAGIWIADESFSSVKRLLSGEQKYRACVAFPIEDGIIYATDTPLEKNHIYRVLVEDEIIRRIDPLKELPGPCIFGTCIGGKYLFATSVEPDSSLPNWRYRITYKLGKGVAERYSHIYIISETGELIEDYREKKDLWPIWLFQFGNFVFPDNHTDEIFATSQSLSCGHGVTVMIGSKSDEL